MDDFEIGIRHGGQDLFVSDFPRDLRGEIAYDIAFVGGVLSSDKNAALELLLYTADQIIKKVRSTDSDSTTGDDAGPTSDMEGETDG